MGRYLLSPLVMEVLANQQPGKGGEIQLTDAMARSLDREAMYAVVIDPLSGYDTGAPPAGSPSTPSWPRPTRASPASSGRPSASAAAWSDRNAQLKMMVKRGESACADSPLFCRYRSGKLRLRLQDNGN